jgi:hypothetical protein
MVIPPARTGNVNNNNTAVTTIDQPNRANLCNLIPGLLILSTVVIKFIAPNKLLIPDKCKENIIRSILGPLCACTPLKGGYNVQPAPDPFSIRLENKNNNKAGGNNQKLILFNLGNAISGPPTSNGSKKLPNPPTNMGITTKNIINIPCEVTILLYN